MKDLSIAKLRKVISLLREKEVTSFKYKDLELTISYSPKQIDLDMDVNQELTPEEREKRDEALINWST